MKSMRAEKIDNFTNMEMNQIIQRRDYGESNWNCLECLKNNDKIITMINWQSKFYQYRPKIIQKCFYCNKLDK